MQVAVPVVAQTAHDSVLPGEQAPTHVPAAHVYGQAAPLCHAAIESHVCGVLPEHWVEPGTHTPVHAPPEHTYGHGEPAGCH